MKFAVLIAHAWLASEKHVHGGAILSGNLYKDEKCQWVIPTYQKDISYLPMKDLAHLRESRSKLMPL